MSDPIRIRLSAHQLARLAALQADADAIIARKNEAVTMAIAGAADPMALASAGWSFTLDAEGITCTPPQSPIKLEA